MEGNSEENHHNGAAYAPTLKMTNKKKKSKACGFLGGEKKVPITKGGALKMKDERKQADDHVSKDFDAMASELEAEKSLTAELRKELEKIRKEKELLETSNKPSSVTAGTTSEVDDQSLSDISVLDHHV
ncbi:uncharacterized protein LOC134218068 [Armigeres subalbatus]|uniref:uncharacterized protein LOC134218068 n=1 Tax=Armigeres subalbatus TaxID=124917 RepID=UPI002ED56EC5